MEINSTHGEFHVHAGGDEKQKNYFAWPYMLLMLIPSAQPYGKLPHIDVLKWRIWRNQLRTRMEEFCCCFQNAMKNLIANKESQMRCLWNCIRSMHLHSNDYNYTCNTIITQN